MNLVQGENYGSVTDYPTPAQQAQGFVCGCDISQQPSVASAAAWFAPASPPLFPSGQYMSHVLSIAIEATQLTDTVIAEM